MNPEPLAGFVFASGRLPRTDARASQRPLQGDLASYIVTGCAVQPT
jgi:hypothetical protein